MERSFISGIVPPDAPTETAWWFVCRGSNVLVQETDDGLSLPLLPNLGAVGLVPLRKAHYLGTLDGVPCYVTEIDKEAPLPEGMAYEQLRSLHERIPDDLFAIAGRAVQIAAWDRNHQFCGHCSARTDYLPSERATRCPNCGLMNFPRLSPAVIVRINRGPELLLARNRNFVGGFYSIIAGFVEPGESLEEAVVREVAEETSIQIKNLRYHGSQPWPYPNSLMLGFTAEYAGGEIHIDESELADAGWFRWDALPMVPQQISIAGQLIAAFVEERAHAKDH